MDNIFKNIKNINSNLIFQEYYIIKDNYAYKIIIEQNNANISIKSNNYINIFNLDNLSLLIKNTFYTLNNAYEYLINLFEENRVIIKNRIKNKEMKLILKLENKKEKEIILYYNNYNKDYYIPEINKLKNNINTLKIEYINIKKEIDNLKIYHENKIPKNMKLLSEITKDSYADYGLDNIFIIFKIINDLLYLIYTNKNKSIISYDLIDKKKIIEIKNAHQQNITNIRHFLDKINKRDLVISISGEDNNIKLWNINNFDLLLNINNINESGFLDSSCFLNDNNNIYIITSNVNYLNSELLKVFDLQGNKIKEINESNDVTVFLDSYYDSKTNKNYIISGNYDYVKSYDFQNNKIYHKYSDGDNNKSHDSIIINIDEDIVKLICTTEDGFIRVWNFHTGVFVNKIEVSDYSIYGICLWNRDYVFVGCKDKSIKLIDIKNGKIVDRLIHCNNYSLTLKKLFFPKYGECLISQGWKNEPIILWTCKN